MKFAPRWAKFAVKQGDKVKPAIAILKESHGRAKAAIKAGEQTSYFSGQLGPSANNEVGLGLEGHADPELPHDGKEGRA